MKNNTANANFIYKNYKDNINKIILIKTEWESINDKKDWYRLLQW